MRGESSHRALVPELLRRQGALLEATGAGPGSAEAARALHRRVARLAELLEEATHRRGCPPDAQAEVLGVGEGLAVPVFVAALRAGGPAAGGADAAPAVWAGPRFSGAPRGFPPPRPPLPPLRGPGSCPPGRWSPSRRGASPSSSRTRCAPTHGAHGSREARRSLAGGKP